MGMAASQARFLGLTARKTNTEYEGQQINQQRTTLANQSANYYNQLLGMTVPVPPSVADYTKTVYTFNDGALNNSLTSMIAQVNGTYLVSYTSTWTNPHSVISTNPVLYTRQETAPGSGEYIYRVGAKELRPLGQGADFTYTVTSSGTEYTGLKFDPSTSTYVDGSGATYTPDAGTTPKIDSYTGDDEYLNTLSLDRLNQLMEEEREYIEMLNDKYGEGNWLVRYVKNTSQNSWVPYFVNKDILDSENTVYSDTGTSLSAVKTYTVGAAQETTEIKGVTARMEQDSTGRIINITLIDDDENEVTYAVTTNTVTDQAKYDDAMNQYEYDKYEYDQSIQEINAKIEIIQAEDRTLELRLKQLDTEQEAIQTEMDAVQKVIEKNTESTFKTFG